MLGRLKNHPAAVAAILASLLAACAATPVEVAKPPDEALDCAGLENELAQAREAESEAKSARIKGALAFGLIGYLASKDGADQAEKSAKERQERLERLARERGCATGEK